MINKSTSPINYTMLAKTPNMKLYFSLQFFGASVISCNAELHKSVTINLKFIIHGILYSSSDRDMNNINPTLNNKKPQMNNGKPTINYGKPT